MMMKFCALLLIVQAFTIFIKPSEASEDKTKLKTCIEEYCKKTYANCKKLCDTIGFCNNELNSCKGGCGEIFDDDDALRKECEKGCLTTMRDNECRYDQSKISLKDCVKEANCFGVKHKNINLDEECRLDCVKVKKNCVKNILKNKFIQGA
ncbi:unnamed protein product [Trichobilharzia szidati]|nr:unnamed protein product [Trichobilharzia szidati]